MIDNILARLNGVQGSKGRYRSRCPSHGSKSLTLALRESQDGSVLVHCHAGCTVQEIMSSIGLPMSELFPEGSVYTPKPKDTKKEITYHELILDIARNDAKKRKLSTQEKQQELDSYRKLKELLNDYNTQR
jgi:hypothetical protein